MPHATPASFSASRLALATLAPLKGLWDTWSAQGVAHLLVVFTGTPLTGLNLRGPGVDRLQATLQRTGDRLESLAQRPQQGLLAQGILCSWVWLDPGCTVFEHHQLLNKALKGLLAEHPKNLGVALQGEQAQAMAGRVAYVCWLNGVTLPVQKKSSPQPLQRLLMAGCLLPDRGVDAARQVAHGNTLARALTVLPPNQLTPGVYRQQLRVLARQQSWAMTEWGESRLARLGAGAFLAVAQGSGARDAAIVRLRYRGPRARRRVAVVGKGICFDTGGHNLKPARYMYNMHEDMNGSAVALGVLWAATQLRLPLQLDCWLALAQNHIGPRAYKQNDVVHALDGTSIEIIHTDAEGRMVLADTLSLAVRDKPHLILDFATLTGSMHTALGSRHSGLFATRSDLARLAVAVGAAVGERVVAFPMSPDYDEALESKVADVKQCTPEGEADHILAARFLSRFVGTTPWLHMDLSAARHEGGLGAVGTEVTGFGVNWGVHFLDSWLQNPL